MWSSHCMCMDSKLQGPRYVCASVYVCTIHVCIVYTCILGPCVCVHILCVLYLALAHVCICVSYVSLCEILESGINSFIAQTET